MYKDKPCAEEIDHLVKEVCVRNAVQSCVNSEKEEHDVSHIAHT